MGNPLWGPVMGKPERRRRIPWDSMLSYIGAGAKPDMTSCGKQYEMRSYILSCRYLASISSIIYTGSK